MRARIVVRTRVNRHASEVAHDGVLPLVAILTVEVGPTQSFMHYFLMVSTGE
jgi:hypothetical protein